MSQSQAITPAHPAGCMCDACKVARGEMPQGDPLAGNPAAQLERARQILATARSGRPGARPVPPGRNSSASTQSTPGRNTSLQAHADSLAAAVSVPTPEREQIARPSPVMQHPDRNTALQAYADARGPTPYAADRGPDDNSSYVPPTLMGVGVRKDSTGLFIVDGADVPLTPKQAKVLAVMLLQALLD